VVVHEHERIIDVYTIAKIVASQFTLTGHMVYQVAKHDRYYQ